MTTTGDYWVTGDNAETHLAPSLADLAERRPGAVEPAGVEGRAVFVWRVFARRNPSCGSEHSARGRLVTQALHELQAISGVSSRSRPVTISHTNEVSERLCLTSDRSCRSLSGTVNAAC